ncbi:NAD(P)-binding protein [Ruania alkalisoli]|uniref:NAD(P)-binding protein n=1 Tax=Ruania alkalisoli TaxID=2779775 RepID=A0A7M1SVL2_9MICO|nr:NAD(P)-binding protein [Ruania alkalisoli]QOR71565.1 NAD(P)-binding protein [Ruania alkalisoli]
MGKVDSDYLVVGAGAAGMAFTDALIDHSDASVTLVDRRPGPGGHWLDAYPFVRLHQASSFYGVASTLLGEGRRQTQGPETGLHERADREQICAYYQSVLNDRFVASGQVRFIPRSHYDWDRRVLTCDGTRYEVSQRCRIVDARYLAPEIPATTPPPFEVADQVRVVAVNDLPRVDDAPSQYVIVGSGKTATDAVIWLLGQGVDPEAICWVRPREPWMLNRAKVQPDPDVFLGMAADIFESAVAARSVDDLFLRLEEAGVMMPINRALTPTMARAPTLATWELDLLRSIENVVRRGRLRRVERGRLNFDGGAVDVHDDALVVHCAAHGLRHESSMPIWGRDAITVQPTRAGFPCFGAALIGYIEATRVGDDAKNQVCPSSPYPSTPADWVRTNIHGTRSAMAFGAEPDIAAWAHTVALNPARVPAGLSSPALQAVQHRLATQTGPGLAALVRLHEREV